MSSPAHELTSTGRLIANLFFAAVIYFGLQYLPEFPYKNLAGLAALALLATFVRGFSLPSASSQGTSAGRLEGSIKWFNGTKGFGFIVGNDGEEVFVHFRNIEGLGKRNVKPGQRVSYVVANSDRGPQAEDVRPQ